MEKLVKQFIKIGQDKDRYNTAFDSAEECKKVACDFAWFMMNGNPDITKTWK
jgi:hypothetical protein